MRTIKFRAWDKESRRFLNGDFSLGIESGEFRGKYGEVFTNIDILQFTGLHDKNGKEIYEGDILEDTLGRKKLVEYYKDGFWLNAFLEGAEWCLRRENSTSKVIGNIHENPELL